MKKSKWIPKPGERVRVYGGSVSNLVVSYKKCGTVGLVLEKDGIARVCLDGENREPYSFYIKQLRRLVPKKKEGVWVTREQFAKAWNHALGFISIGHRREALEKIEIESRDGTRRSFHLLINEWAREALRKLDDK